MQTGHTLRIGWQKPRGCDRDSGTDACRARLRVQEGAVRCVAVDSILSGFTPFIQGFCGVRAHRVTTESARAQPCSEGGAGTVPMEPAEASGRHSDWIDRLPAASRTASGHRIERSFELELVSGRATLSLHCMPGFPALFGIWRNLRSVTQMRDSLGYRSCWPPDGIVGLSTVRRMYVNPERRVRSVTHECGCD